MPPWIANESAFRARPILMLRTETDAPLRSFIDCGEWGAVSLAADCGEWRTMYFLSAEMDASSLWGFIYHLRISYLVYILRSVLLFVLVVHCLIYLPYSRQDAPQESEF